ncbi:histone-lysine N-methyltransferase SETMAR [Trichonephila clavipes]|uniref:Histone-lysine N-methyltransferase SETMAR n=1 Tax=Trichonephila clavipes TaxID=2585209 RepID=A0A8X6VQ35_TRICX|nr:histone-lysine N-methyltransferase SETMAR [Trichonephila clavipes]
MIFYDFKTGLNQEESVKRMQLAFGDESVCRGTVFRWFTEFCSGHNSLQDEEHTGRPRSVVIPDNVLKKNVNG